MTELIDVPGFQFRKLKCLKLIELSKDFFILPMEYNKRKLIIQTSMLNIPNNIYKYENSDKQYITFEFPYLCDTKQIEFRNFLFNLEDYIIENKIPKLQSLSKRFQNISLKSIFSKNNQKLQMNIQIHKENECFDANNKLISINKVSNSNKSKAILMLSGLWITKNSIGFMWSIIQLKLYIGKRICFIEDDNPIKTGDSKLTITNSTQSIECPCCKNTIWLENKLSILKSMDSKYDKYVKMKKLGIPVAAILQKIEMDGLDPNTFRSFLQKSSNTLSHPSKLSNFSKKSPKRSPNKINMLDLLNGKNKLKKRKPTLKKKQTFKIPKNMNIPTLSDIKNSLKSLKSTGIKLR